MCCISTEWFFFSGWHNECVCAHLFSYISIWSNLTLYFSKLTSLMCYSFSGLCILNISLWLARSNAFEYFVRRLSLSLSLPSIYIAILPLLVQLGCVVVSAADAVMLRFASFFSHMWTFRTLHIRVNYFARAYRIQGYNRAHIIFRWMLWAHSYTIYTTTVIQHINSNNCLPYTTQSHSHSIQSTSHPNEPTSSIIEIWFNSHLNNSSSLPIS